MKVLNFGSCNVDYVYKVDHIIKAGETLSADSIEIFPGGKGLNQSIAIAKAGTRVYHAGIVGADGIFLKDTLKASGADTSFVRMEEGKSGHAIIQVDSHGENCICVFDGTNGHVDHGFVDEVLSHFERGDIILLQNEISSIDYILDRAYEKGMRVVLNPSPYNEKVARLDLRKVSYLILNETEAKEISGEGDPKDFVRFMRGRYPDLEVVLTLGRNGAVYFANDVSVEHPAFSVEVVDTTSAGDTFTGYFVSLLASGKTVKEALKYASAASAITVSRLGAAVSIPYIGEVKERLPHLTPIMPSSKSREEILTEKIETYVKSHLAEATLGELAALLGYSTTYAGAVVKELTGMTFSALCQTERCLAAAKMLSEGVPVGEAIKRVGYENESFFRKKFKELYGKSPKECKKRV